MRLSYLCAVFGTLICGAASAQDRIEPWPTVLTVVPVADKWSASVEGIGRVAREDDKPSQFELRLELGRALNKRLTVWAGYVHVSTYRPSVATNTENQMVEQANWKIGTIASISASSRTRLEQRFIAGAGGTAWRLREQVRLTVPFKKNGPLFVVWSEPFIALNRTNASQTTFDQIRSFAGVSMAVSRHADVEIGYLNQHMHRINGDTANDVIPVVLTMRF